MNIKTTTLLLLTTLTILNCSQQSSNLRKIQSPCKDCPYIQDLLTRHENNLENKKAYNILKEGINTEIPYEVHHENNKIVVQSQQDDKLLGRILYTIITDKAGEKTLFIDHTKSEIKQIGIHKFLMAILILENQDITYLSGQLREDNRDIYKFALMLDKSPDEAIKETPSYKTRKALGYSKFYTFIKRYDSLLLVTTKDEENP